MYLQEFDVVYKNNNINNIINAIFEILEVYEWIMYDYTCITQYCSMAVQKDCQIKDKNSLIISKLLDYFFILIP